MNFNTIILNYFSHLKAQHQKHFIVFIAQRAKIMLPGMEKLEEEKKEKARTSSEKRSKY